MFFYFFEYYPSKPRNTGHRSGLLGYAYVRRLLQLIHEIYSGAPPQELKQEIVNFGESPRDAQVNFSSSAKQNKLLDNNQMMIAHSG
jgi:hypothetical protein